MQKTKVKLAAVVQWYNNTGVKDATHTLTYQIGAANILTAEHNFNDDDVKYCLLLIKTRAASLRDTMDRIIKECDKE